jgi:hypothetical protein
MRDISATRTLCSRTPHGLPELDLSLMGGARGPNISPQNEGVGIDIKMAIIKL